MKINVQGKEYDVNVAEMMRIDPLNMDKMFEDQPGRMAYVGEILSLARFEMEMSKIELDVRLAKEDDRIRKALAASGEKTTEARVEKMVLAADNIVAARTKVAAAMQVYELVRAWFTALEHRKDMLVSMGADIRQEKGELARSNTDYDL